MVFGFRPESRSPSTGFPRWERVGVPFQQCGYVPDDLSGRLRFSDFIEFERDWPTTNRERGELIDKNIAGTLTLDERIRLDALQAYADYHITQVAPHSTGVLEELENRLFLGPMCGVTVQRDMTTTAVIGNGCGTNSHFGACTVFIVSSGNRVAQLFTSSTRFR
ncbi:MAG: hypothetical protein WCF26_02265 [Candidatus Sulfotelmatobacter sp.]